MDSSRSLFLFIDELRYNKGYTIFELTEGIVSERTYRRYVHGITKVSQEDVFKFIERLGMSVVEFYDAYENFITTK
ncbi:MAG: hypothetical protein AB7U79_08325 [Candidatus Izemoplasmatales bacterium]